MGECLKSPKKCVMSYLNGHIDGLINNIIPFIETSVSMIFVRFLSEISILSICLKKKNGGFLENYI